MSGFKTFRLTLKPPSEVVYEGYFDVVIIGAGPAGLSAALYSARYGLKTIVIATVIGGAITEAPLVDDYLGIPEIPGSKLAEKFVDHVRKYNVPILVDQAIDLYRESDRHWCVKTKGGRKICGHAIILAMGSEKRKLGVPGEEELIGKGVSYCATCDGPLFKDKYVAVVGGGNSALVSAIYLSSLATRVYLIHRRDQFRAFKIYVDQVMNNPKIELVLNSVVTEIVGRDRVEGVKVKSVITGEEKYIKVDGVFVEIGSKPPREFFEKIGLEVDEQGYAVVKPDQSTNLPGIYVAGDAAGGPYKYRFEQAITAAAEGAKAADAAFKYILSLKKS